MLTPRGKKSALTGGSEEERTLDAASRRTASPTRYRLSYSGPRTGFEPRFPRPSHTKDLHVGTVVSTLPHAWRRGFSAWTGWPSVNVLRPDEIAYLICNFYLSLAARNKV